MGHTPHFYVPGPWQVERIALSPAQRDHLTKVLRMRGDGVPITYSDGSGTVGRGSVSDGAVIRGAEEETHRPKDLVVAVAPPKDRDRQRFLVEKLGEIGVSKLLWLGARFGQASPPPRSRAMAWAISALEQSRGAWLMEVGDGLVGWDDLDQPLVVCVADGAAQPTPGQTVVVGPEGGWAEGEIPQGAARWSLGATVLRVETAAVVAAARMP